MFVKDVMVKNQVGLHARPATEISKEAMKYKSDIKFVVNGKTLNAKSPLMIMAAGINIEFNLSVPDAELAIEVFDCIEIVGILLDNAVEALNKEKDKSDIL